MSFFKFDPSARLQQFLGRELIADPNIALIEFVKNSYDAGATEVTLKFDKLRQYKAGQEIVISDNGMGMNPTSFEKNWMHPGYSYKATSEKATSVGQGPASLIAEQRVASGEKGLGRLAAGRLGEKLEVFTRETTDEHWLHVVFDWAQFKDMDRYLNQIEIPYDTDTIPLDPKYKTGTILVITNLTIDWERRIPGRKIRNRSEERIGRLWQDLRILAQPLSLTPYGFRIYLEVDSFAHRVKKYSKQVEPDLLQLLDYQYDFSVKQTDEGIVIDWRVKRSEEIANFVRKGLETQSRDKVVTQGNQQHYVKPIETSSYSNQDEENRPNTLRCGEFSGTFFYSASQHAIERAKKLGIAPGVFLYRDALRVDPYGQGDDDWLGVRAHKASRQGYAPIQPNNLSGYVRISKATNPELIDMSNRQGLVENDAYDDFMAFIISEFRRFEGIVFDEYVEPRWVQPEDRAQIAATRAQSFGVAISRAILHSIRQPVSGLLWDVAELKDILESLNISDDIKTDLLRLQGRLSQRLITVDGALDRLITFDQKQTVERFEELDLQEVITEAIDRVKLSADALGINIVLEQTPRKKVVFERSSLVEATVELINNAIRSVRPEGRSPGWIKIKAEKAEEPDAGSGPRGGYRSGYKIVVLDNGEGITDEVREKLFLNTVSTKGHIGVGLLALNELLAVFGAKYSLVQSSDQGAEFQIWIPSDGRNQEEIK